MLSRQPPPVRLAVRRLEEALMRNVLILTVVTTLLTAGCATNPATGRREISLISEQQAIQIGLEQHPLIVEEFGVYDEIPELNRMVDEIGRRIAAASDRPDLPWRFTLLDTPMINAMALPGGQIYVTRGILERMNSEDELAGVIGHEIAHVAAKHAEQRISQSQLAQIGLVLGSVLAGPAATQAYGGLAQLGAQLLFQRYSRSQESHADVLGTAYMAESGYNPSGAANMLMVLQRLNSDGVSSLEQYFLSHPDPALRVQTVRNEIAQLEAKSAGSFTDRSMERDPFIRKMEGMIAGPSTLQTTIRDNTVYQRRHGIVMPVPAGWTATTAPGTLFSMSPEKATGGGFVVQEIPVTAIQGARSVQDGIRTLVQRMNLRYVTSTEATTRTGERFTVDLWTGRSQQGVVSVETTQFAEGDKIVVMMQITQGAQGNQSILAGHLAGTRFDRELARRVEPARMRLGTVPSATWAEAAARATGDRADAETVAHINGFDVGDPVPRSLLLKLPQAVAD